MLDTEYFLGPLVAPLLIVVCSVLFYWYSTQNFDYWKKRNVKYVKPIPFVGSVIDNLSNPLHEIDYERRLKYGNIYGHFEGTRPVISVGEPSLLRQIFVKDFHLFADRRNAQLGEHCWIRCPNADQASLPTTPRDRALPMEMTVLCFGERSHGKLSSGKRDRERSRLSEHNWGSVAPL
ncbi:cytochrome P450 3A11 [Trichonephila clavipes]|nr:cytochrome P450 3A11 [Trichonephila clavipes]